jgi:hypothetical protein
MSFEFTDLNAQLVQANQICVLYTTQTACLCLSRPPTLHCYCLSNYVTCRCFTNLITYCRCLSRPIITIPCICLSKPIVTGRPPTIRDFTIYEQVAEVTREVSHVSELDLLRAELDDAIKQIDVAREVMDRTGPAPAENFDNAETQLKQQLELLQKQRAEYTKKGVKK